MVGLAGEASLVPATALYSSIKFLPNAIKSHVTFCKKCTICPRQSYYIMVLNQTDHWMKYSQRHEYAFSIKTLYHFSKSSLFLLRLKLNMELSHLTLNFPFSHTDEIGKTLDVVINMLLKNTGFITGLSIHQELKRGAK